MTPSADTVDRQPVRSRATPTPPHRRSFIARRSIFAVLVCATLSLLSWRVYEFLALNGTSLLEWGIFVLFIILEAPIVLSFWTAVLGFVLQCRGGDPLEVTRTGGAHHRDTPLPLTAIILPVYNEDPARVMAGLKATYKSLEATGQLSSFEFFILSDTTDPDVWVREELAFVEVRREVGDPGRIFYRNRRQNTERKTGNIADFCASWGGRYEYMIVFDADSVMAGESLVNLVRLMEQHPQAGIIQAPPLPVNRQSLFGRMQQFAVHAYSVLFIGGLNFWQGGAGNYWGHNAIIRIRPFIEHCRLPTLSGKPPLGGSILSHDFVEAAFMRRAGWRVYLASQLHGSYEEMPSSLLGYAARDRRWCQGNLQHGRLLFTPGLHLISRIHIWVGIMGYVASPLWLLMLSLATAEGIRQTLIPHTYFAAAHAPYPNWPVALAGPALALFGLIMAFLLLPKALSVVLHLRGSRSHDFGGRIRLIASAFVELIISTLLAPNLALLQSRFVISILMGSNAKWEAQDRGDSGTPWTEAIQYHWPATLLGLVWTIILAVLAPDLIWWFSPVLLGFLLAIPLSVWTSKARAGLGARNLGLFLIPEEISPPQVIRFLEEETERNCSRKWTEPVDALVRVMMDPDLKDLHLALLPAADGKEDELQRHRRDGLVLKYARLGPYALTSQEKRELLLHRESVLALAQPRPDLHAA